MGQLAPKFQQFSTSLALTPSFFWSPKCQQLWSCGRSCLLRATPILPLFLGAAERAWENIKILQLDRGYDSSENVKSKPKGKAIGIHLKGCPACGSCGWEKSVFCQFACFFCLQPAGKHLHLQGKALGENPRIQLQTLQQIQGSCLNICRIPDLPRLPLTCDHGTLQSVVLFQASGYRGGQPPQ